MEARLLLYVIVLCHWVLNANSTETCSSDHLGKYRILENKISTEAVHTSHDNYVRLECLAACTNTDGCTHASMVGSTCNVHTTPEAVLNTSGDDTSIVIVKYQTPCALKHDAGGLQGHGDHSVTGVATEHECFLLCVEANNIVCRSAEYYLSGDNAGSCQMSVDNYASADASYHVAPLSVRFYEICQFL